MSPRRRRINKDVSGYTPIFERDEEGNGEPVVVGRLTPEEIKSLEDSGGGAVKADTGKLRIDLFPGDALFAISEILTFGANKYTDRNWEKGMKWSRPFGALMRHMWAWWQGATPTKVNFAFGDLDMETGKSHLWHAGCCIVFLIAYEIRGVGLDDRPGNG